MQVDINCLLYDKKKIPDRSFDGIRRREKHKKQDENSKIATLGSSKWQFDLVRTASKMGNQNLQMDQY